MLTDSYGTMKQTRNHNHEKKIWAAEPTHMGKYSHRWEAHISVQVAHETANRKNFFNHRL